eukprot:6386255-Ditylum_brightwellii.AAC.1
MTGVYIVLGASIGSQTMLDNVIIDFPLLVSIGKCCSIGFSTHLVCGELWGNCLVLAPCTLEKIVKTEPRASIAPGANVPATCLVRAWSYVTASLGKSQKAQEIHGLPASHVKEIVPFQGH